MRVARSNRDHSRIGRDVPQLEARAPQLIKLPISIPSIPILGAILTPLIGGTNKAAATTPAPTTTAATQATPTPAPTVTTPPTATTSGGSGNSGNSSSFDGNSDGATGVSGSASDASETSAGSSPQPSESTTDGGSSDQDGTNNTSSSSGLNVPVANAGGSINPTTGGNSGSDSSTSGNLNSIPSSKAALPSGNGLPGSTAVSGPNGASTGSSNASNSSGGISGGAIAGIIVVLVLILLAIALILFRKRYMSRRTERINQWWEKAGSRASSEKDGPNNPVRSDGRASARSSFATTFDHAQTPRLSTSFDNVPPLPPMAEIRGQNDGFLLYSPNSAIADSPVLITFDKAQAPLVTLNRTSVHSARSVASDGSGAQYLEVPNGDTNGQEVTTPMSVRPFSPSESFAFPKPPNKQSGDWSSSSVRPTSSHTYYSASQSTTDLVPTVPANPFSDPALPVTEFEVEAVRRPFVSTRFDELSVAVSDSVRVMKLFDDGWALVEKLPSIEDIVHKKYNSASGVQGLIPIDCLRAEGQDLTSFFSEKLATRALYDKRASSMTYTVPAA
ncbi:hypothetical protein H0H87_004553 [Tephrocybe sp. NHM501043]|nr:hypothetical protein H0H87_004553 [Tephrocybe sp. NHM501043]